MNHSENHPFSFIIHPEIKHSQCRLIGGSGVVLQLFLGVIAIGLLVYKRYNEFPQRPFLIWTLDATKQILSCIIKSLPGLDECNQYFVTILIDVFGCITTCMLIQRIDGILNENGQKNLKQGKYYIASNIKIIENIKDTQQQELDIPIQKYEFVYIFYTHWFIQLGIWLTLNFIVKMCFFAMQFFIKTILGIFSFYFLFPLNKFPKFKLFTVMCIVPTILNMGIFWIQDNFLKKHDFDEDEEEIYENPEELEREQIEQFNLDVKDLEGKVGNELNDLSLSQIQINRDYYDNISGNKSKNSLNKSSFLNREININSNHLQSKNDTAFQKKQTTMTLSPSVGSQSNWK